MSSRTKLKNKTRQTEKIFFIVLFVFLSFFSSQFNYFCFAEAEPLPTVNNATPKIKLESPSVVTLNAGDERDIKLDIRNVGAAMAYNDLTQAVVDATAPFSVSFENFENSAPVISATGSKSMNLHVKVDKNAKAGNYTVTLKHSFTDEKKTNYNETDTFVIKIKNEISTPIINISDFTNTSSQIMPGDKFSLSAVIKNDSSQNAHELQVSIDGIKTEEINLANSTMATYFPDFSAGIQKYLSFDFIASTKIKSGSYPLTFKVSYKDADNQTYEKSFFYYVNIGSQAESEKPQIELTDIIVPTKTFGVGENATVSMKLKNTGSVDVNNVKVTATADADGGVVPKSASVILTRVLKKSEAKDLNFIFAPTSKSKTQNYAIKFQVEYENGTTTEDKTSEKANTDSFEQYIGLNVSNPEAEVSGAPQSKPKIIVSNYSTNPLIVTAGSEFDLNMTFKNTHKNKRVENTKVLLTIDEATTSDKEQKGNVFTPVDGSTNFYIGDIAPNSQVERKLRLYTVPTATPKNYSVTVDFEYEDDKHNEIKSSEKIGISVKQATKLDTSEINTPTEAFIDQPSMITFDFYNTGKVNLSNLLIKIEGENFDTKQSPVYYGKFDTGASETYEGTFTPKAAGEQKGKVIISYEDDASEVKSQEIEFTVNVQEMPPMPENLGDTKPVETQKKSIWTNIYLWLGVALFIIIMIIVIIKIRKKKKKGDFDE